MSVIPLDRLEFEQLATDLLQNGHKMRFRARGVSMRPFILDGDILTAKPLSDHIIQRGDILLYHADPSRLMAHRVVGIKNTSSGYRYSLKGDSLFEPDSIIQRHQALGIVIAIEHNGVTIRTDTRRHKVNAILWMYVYPIVRRIYLSIKNIKRKYLN